MAVFWYQILLSPICSCIHFQVWFYFTCMAAPFYTKGVFCMRYYISNSFIFIRMQIHIILSIYATTSQWNADNYWTLAPQCIATVKQLVAYIEYSNMQLCTVTEWYDSVHQLVLPVGIFSISLTNDCDSCVLVYQNVSLLP